MSHHAGLVSSSCSSSVPLGCSVCILETAAVHLFQVGKRKRSCRCSRVPSAPDTRGRQGPPHPHYVFAGSLFWFWFCVSCGCVHLFSLIFFTPTMSCTRVAVHPTPPHHHHLELLPGRFFFFLFRLFRSLLFGLLELVKSALEWLRLLQSRRPSAGHGWVQRSLGSTRKLL